MSYRTEVYRVIRDYKKLEAFVESLPDLGEGYKYYITLFARKKYGGTPGLTSDKCQLKRVVASKDRIIHKLKQMEVPLGAYTFRGKEGEGDVVVGQQSLVAYISANPRDMRKAGGATAKVLVSKIVDGQPIKNPHAEALSQIQVHGKKIFFNVDIDFTEEYGFIHEADIKRFVSDVLNEDAYKLIRTRGGYHMLVELDKINPLFKKNWYNGLQHMNVHPNPVIHVDLKNGDGMLPIPGCVQSDFTPFVV
jgi:hypothetical protein